MAQGKNGSTRREFLKTGGVVVGTAGLWGFPLRSLAFRPDIVNPLRSEERRVGKECRL